MIDTGWTRDVLPGAAAPVSTGEVLHAWYLAERHYASNLAHAQGLIRPTPTRDRAGREVEPWTDFRSRYPTVHHALRAAEASARAAEVFLPGAADAASRFAALVTLDQGMLSWTCYPEGNLRSLLIACVLEHGCTPAAVGLVCDLNLVSGGVVSAIRGGSLPCLSRAGQVPIEMASFQGESRLRWWSVLSRLSEVGRVSLESMCTWQVSMDLAVMPGFSCSRVVLSHWIWTVSAHA